jgi:hypothetical protein
MTLLPKPVVITIHPTHCVGTSSLNINTNGPLSTEENSACGWAQAVPAEHTWARVQGALRAPARRGSQTVAACPTRKHTASSALIAARACVGKRQGRHVNARVMAAELVVQKGCISVVVHLWGGKTPSISALTQRLVMHDTLVVLCFDLHRVAKTKLL